MRALRSPLRCRKGNVATLFALVMPVVIGSLALAIDYGNLTLQERKLQKAADLAAVVAAASIEDAEQAAAKYFALNGLDIAVETEQGLLLDEHYLPDERKPAGVARVVRGRYVADPALAVDQRFVATGAGAADAVRVSVTKPGLLHFAGMFAEPPQLGVVGAAAAQAVAGISIGSRLASLDAGLLNTVLGAMLGSEISLTAMDYEALLDAEVDALSFMDTLATQLDLEAATYDTVLETELALPALLGALRQSGGLASPARGALYALESAVPPGTPAITPGRLLNLDPLAGEPIGASGPWAMEIGALEAAFAAIALANGGAQIDLTGAVDLPGLASVDLSLVVGEPPVGSTAHALAPADSAVRTAQTRLVVDARIEGLQALAGTTIRVPLYVAVAHAEAVATDIQCSPGAIDAGTVSVDALPGVAEIAIGAVDGTLSDFSDAPQVAPVDLVNLANLVRIGGKAHVAIENHRPTALFFDRRDIAENRVKRVATHDMLGSTTATLLQNLDLEIDVLGLSLGPAAEILYKNALFASLSEMAAPLDRLLSNLLALAGVRVGEADVRVTGIACERPTLVQ